MDANVGGIDRVIRIVAGAILIGLVLNSSIGPWGWIGIIPIATGLVGFCPVYLLFGFRTCPLKRK